MSSMPPIIVTELDRLRLERLIDALETFSPAAEALETELSRARVVRPEEVPAGVVTMNSRIHCRENSSGKDHRLTLVYPHDAGPEGHVSILAPVGCALLGLSVGQEIDWPAPGGHTLRLTLLDVEYQPEAAGDYER